MDVMKPFFEQQPLRFGCTGCGRCCIAGNDYFVYLGSEDAGRIRGYLGLSVDWFRRRYLGKTTDGDPVLAYHADGRCVFLQNDNSCRIYPVRPVQCRTYPFWPEVTNSKTAWQRESRRCEGINRGPGIPVTTIRRILNACHVNSG
jgi:Fe-S-cluster containining protein